MEKSGQGPKGAIAVALARPLEAQPGIYRLQTSPPNSPVAKVLQLSKLGPPLVTMAVSRAIGQTQCNSSRMGGGGLLKAVQEASLASLSGHWPLHHINS